MVPLHRQGRKFFIFTAHVFLQELKAVRFYFRRCNDSYLAGPMILSSIASMLISTMMANITVNTLTYTADDMGFIGNKFSAALVFTVNNAGQTIRFDQATFASFYKAGCTWAGNAPVVDLLAGQLGGTTLQRPSSPIPFQPYFDTTLGKPIWYNGGWKDATGAAV